MSNRTHAVNQWRLWKREVQAGLRARKPLPEATRTAMADHLAQTGCAILPDGSIVDEPSIQIARSSWEAAFDALKYS